MNKTVHMTCIVCPMGCSLTAECDGDGKVLSVQGNTCPRGEKYARTELTDPRRTLTSSVRIEDAMYDRFLPVKTDGGIPKAKMTEAMEILRNVTVSAPVKRGDVILSDFLGEDIRVIAGKTVERAE